MVLPVFCVELPIFCVTKHLVQNILFSGQHGFRNDHSCETALHELISYLNENRNKRAISLLLFIDFRKAFDLVDSQKLIRKLFHYGFSNSALKLIINYFSGRHQSVKYDKKLSYMRSHYIHFLSRTVTSLDP